MPKLVKAAGKTEYAISDVGEVAACCLIGGRDAATGPKLVPNVTMSFKCHSGKEQYFLNLNRKDVLVTDEKESFVDGKLSLKVGTETDVWYTQGDSTFWDVEFASRPVSNIVRWEILKSAGIRFAHQSGPMVQYDPNGDRVEYVSEKHMGSYAILIDRANNFKRPDGSVIAKYFTGQLGFIYRPEVVDAAGKRAWCKMSIADNVLTVTMPQAFLDNAVYPVTLDPEFGYHTTGSATLWSSNQYIYASAKDAPAGGNGTTDTFYYYGDTNGTTRNIKVGIYDDTGSNAPDNLIGQVEETGVNHSLGWHGIALSVSVTDGTLYWLGFEHNAAGGNMKLRRTNDYGTNEGRINYATYSGSWPDPFGVNASDDHRYSYYIEYTASGGGALLDASVSGTGSQATSLTTQITAKGAVSCAATVAAALTTAIVLAATVTASAAQTGALTTSIPLDAAVSATAAQSSELTVLDIDLFDAAVTASATATGELATQIPFGAAAAGSVTTTAALTTQIQFSSALTATISLASGLTTSITVDCAVSGNCTVASKLTAPQQALLAASPTGTATASAALTTGAPIENVVSYTSYFAKIGAADALFTKSFIKASQFTRKRKKEVWF